MLLAAEEVPSTQTIVQDNTAVLPNGTLCTATRQVAGKGEGDRLVDKAQADAAWAKSTD